MALKIRKNQSPAALCPVGECMAFLRGAWTPNIIWQLSGGARRFSELRNDIKNISAKVLTQRLRELEELGVIHRAVMSTSPPSVEYSLSELGEELMPAIAAIISVGHRLKQRADKAAA